MLLSVLQPWVEDIPVRMQSTLLLGLRGPDTHCVPNVKKIGRWLRGLTFIPGNPDNVLEFMNTELPDRIIEKSDVAKELEFCTQHYYSHLMHALEVVGYKHPHTIISSHAFELYKNMCDLMHLNFETTAEFNHRLRQINWPNGKQPMDVLEAREILESL